MSILKRFVTAPVTAFKNILNFAIILNAFSTYGLPISLKRKYRNAYIKIFLFENYYLHRRTANILGFQVRFLDYLTFSHLFKEIFLNLEYYYVSKEKEPFIIDCGSNIGMSILFFKTMYPSSKVFAFEPDEKSFACLKQNIESNHISNVSLTQCAVGKSEGEIDFFSDRINHGSALMSTLSGRVANEVTQTVKSVCLSKFINTDVDFLKIDVEGAELDVLDDLNRNGKLNLIRNLIIEYHHHIKKECDNLSILLKILEEAGFGYQMHSGLKRPLKGEQFQDIRVFAYKKQP